MNVAGLPLAAWVALLPEHFGDLEFLPCAGTGLFAVDLTDVLGLQASVLLDKPVDCFAVIVLICLSFSAQRAAFEEALQFPGLILALGLLPSLFGVPVLGGVGIEIPPEVDLDGEVVGFVEGAPADGVRIDADILHD